MPTATSAQTNTEPRPVQTAAQTQKQWETMGERDNRKLPAWDSVVRGSIF